jgi:hypothetical protein
MKLLLSVANLVPDSRAMDGAIVDKIIAKFEDKPFDEKTGTEPV